MKWSQDDEELLNLVSHLSSCGIRISTAYEVLNIKPSNKELYNAALDHNHTCHFLRDNVCHKEPADEDKETYKKRQDFINELTIEQLYEYVKEALAEFKKMVLEFSNNYKLLENFLKRKFKNI